QAMVKNKRHIWLFIMGIGSANFVMGLAIYYGIAAWVSSILTEMARAYPQHICRGAMIAGILCFFIGLRLIVKTRGDVRRDLEEEKSEDEGTAAVRKLEHILSKVSAYIVPVVISLAGILLMARYYKFFINQTWGKKENYDLCLNTSRITDLKEFVSGLEKLILEYGKRP
ncbi:MAG TPA: hypothetical protein IAB84_12430, partial [Candidatus Choladousia intestinigallinarum]|nr:hypothetical protein [Candidatus Choladousia intestinigallinarum]